MSPPSGICSRAIQRLLSSLSERERAVLADAARDNDLRAVKAMLAAGWPVDARGQHQATPLHWAAWNGNSDMIRELLRHRAPVDVKGDEYDGTPLFWAVYGSVHGWRCRTGDYAGAVETLIAAGAQVPKLTPELERQRCGARRPGSACWLIGTYRSG